ncbi:MAG: glycosyltransferase family 4 protein [Methanomassiliicoccales archaeon]
MKDDSIQKKRIIAFLPAVHLPIKTNERIPKMFSILSQHFEAIQVPLSRLNHIVYDQQINKFPRYILFMLDESLIFLKTIVISKRNKVALVFAENSYLFLAGGFAARILRVPAVWDNHGNIKLFAESLGKSKSFISSNVILEKVLENLATRVFVVSHKDKDAYLKMGFDVGKFEVIPISADMTTVSRNRMSKEEARRKLRISPGGLIVLFFGTLNYYPNLEAVEYLVNEVYPTVKQRFPEVRFYVAGSGEYPGKLPEGVIHLGFVPFDPDLCTWLCAADVGVAPLWKGVGVLTKIVDMLSAGLPSVLSPLAKEGIPELEHGKNCLIGLDRLSFVEELSALLGDSDLQRRLGDQGKKLIAERYSWESVSPKIWDILDSLINVGERR